MAPMAIQSYKLLTKMREGKEVRMLTVKLGLTRLKKGKETEKRRLRLQKNEFLLLFACHIRQLPSLFIPACHALHAY
jgi:hypothetical protein